MRTLSALCVCLALAACQGEGTVTVIGPDPGTGTPAGTGTSSGTGSATGGGGCGDVNHWVATLSGRVLQQGGGPAAGADVWLEERNWFPQGQIMGTAVVRGDGSYTIDIADLVDVEDCWGTALDYVVVAELGPLTDERAANTALFASVSDGTLAATIADLTLQ